VIINKNINLCFALSLLVINISCTGSIKNSPDQGASGTLSQSPLETSERLVSWESKPQVVGHGNGLQLMLKTSEGMNFIYAGHKGSGQDLFYLSSHNVGDTFSKPYSINETP